MVKGLYIAASSMLPRQFMQEAVTNNLANASTTGYKKDRVFIRSLIDARQFLAYRAGDVTGTRVENVRTDYQQGPITETGNAFDFLLSGRGFFSVQTANGTLYTRNGRCYRATDGTLVNSQGDPILGEAGPIIVTGGRMDVTEGGDVLVDGVYVDTLRIRDFPGADNLLKAGDSLLVPLPGVTPQATPGTTRVMQGYVEESNVNTVEEMVNMIDILRNFEMLQRLIQMQDHTLQLATTEIGVVR